MNNTTNNTTNNNKENNNDNNNNSTTSPSQQTSYNDLLTAISSLQFDLQRTVGFAGKLKRENGMLKSGYDEMKTALLRTRKRYGETRGALMEHMSESDKREKNVEIVVMKWKAQLESRTKELENLQVSGNRKRGERR